MSENKELIIDQPLSLSQKALSMLLGCGVVLAATHGAFVGDHHQDLTPVDFTAKVVKDLHVHNDFSPQFAKILVDPKSLRSVRSEGDKTAEIDGLRGNWDAYTV